MGGISDEYTENKNLKENCEKLKRMREEIGKLTRKVNRSDAEASTALETLDKWRNNKQGERESEKNHSEQW